MFYDLTTSHWSRPREVFKQPKFYGRMVIKTNNYSSENQRAKVMKRWAQVRKTELSLSVSNQKERNELHASLIAYLQGDGCVCSWGKGKKFHTAIAFYPDDVEMANYIILLYQKLYGRKLNLMDMGKYYLIRTTHKTAFLELKKLAKYSSLEWEIPKFTTNSQKISWLRAFFDCEAYVNEKIITVQSVNRKGILQIQNLLLESGIHSRTYQYVRKQKTWNINYLLVINKREDRQRFLKTVSFNHSRKRKKLEESIAGVA